MGDKPDSPNVPNPNPNPQPAPGAEDGGPQA